jgi:tRNA dimethylallyltransferase
MAPPGDGVLRSVLTVSTSSPKPTVLVIVGPTACGKTALALALAARCPIEVVSADSRTVYRWMDIGTAKPTRAERARVPHHLLDVVDPDESYSLAQYQMAALAAIARIFDRGRLPVLVGGAGLYVSAVCDGLRLPDVAPDLQFRAALEARAKSDGWPALQAELARVDPESAARIEPRNVRRVIRALEVHHATGVRFSDFQQRSEPPFRPVFIGLDVDRQELYRRIDARIDSWLANGLVDEVHSLLQRGYMETLPSMSSIGYREVARLLRGELARDEAAAQMKRSTHQYARRQLTWFRRDQRIQWLSQPTPDDVLPLLDG